MSPALFLCGADIVPRTLCPAVPAAVKPCKAGRLVVLKADEGKVAAFGGSLGE